MNFKGNKLLDSSSPGLKSGYYQYYVSKSTNISQITINVFIMWLNIHNNIIVYKMLFVASQISYKNSRKFNLTTEISDQFSFFLSFVLLQI